MTEVLRPDFCVIGGGPGGLAAARAAAGFGAQVVVVEKRALGGIEHLRLAWQAQILAAAAARSAAQRSGTKFGLPKTDVRIDFKRLRRESEAAISRFAREDSPATAHGSQHPTDSGGGTLHQLARDSKPEKSPSRPGGFSLPSALFPRHRRLPAWNSCDP